MAKEEQFLKGDDVRTMRKDIVTLQQGGKIRSLSSKGDSKVAQLEFEKQKLKQELKERKRLELIRKTKEEQAKLAQLEQQFKQKKTQESVQEKQIIQEQQRKEQAFLERKEQIAQENQKKMAQESERKEEQIQKAQEQRSREMEERKQHQQEAEKKKKLEMVRQVEQEREQKEQEEQKRERRKKEIEEQRKQELEAERLRRAEQEKQKREEEQERAQQPERQRESLLNEKKEIQEERDVIDKDLQELTRQKKPLDGPKAVLLKEIKGIEKVEKAISRREERAEEDKRSIQEKELLAKGVKEKKKIEQERWKVEKKIRELEEKRWPWDQKIRDISRKIDELDAQYADITLKEQGLLKQKDLLDQKEDHIDLGIEKIDLNKDLKEIEKAKKDLSQEKTDLFGELVDIEDELKTITTEEDKIEEDEKVVVEEERVTKDLTEKRELEKERWDLEEKRRETETHRWNLEEEKEKIDFRLKRIETRFQVYLDKAGNMIERIKKIDKLLGKETISEEKKEEFFAPASDLSTAKKIEEEVEEPLKIEKEVKEKPIPKKEILPPEVKEVPLEVKKASQEKSQEEQEIEEAKKRIEALKEKRNGTEKKPAPIQEEVEKELEQGVGFEEDEEEKKEEPAVAPVKPNPFRGKPIPLAINQGSRPQLKSRFRKAMPTSVQIEQEKQAKQVIKKPSTREKLWVRVLVFSLILVFLAGMATFWYWYLVIRIQTPDQPIACETNQDCSAEQVCGGDKVCITPPPEPICSNNSECSVDQVCTSEGMCVEKEIAIVVPESLFLVDDTRTLSIEKSEELDQLLLQTVQEYQENGEFKRIIVENMEERKLLSLGEIFDALDVRVPNEMFDKIGKNFTLFVFSQIDGNRLGFVTETIETQSLTDLMTAKETTMKDDFNPWVSLMDGGTPSIASPFRNASQISGYSGPNFKFQTLAKNDLGLVYLISDQHFIFTSSWKSMTSVIDKLEVAGPTIEIKNDLKIGDRGDEVRLLQLWLADDPTIYPEAIVSGYFGKLTNAAVIKFQEKHDNEILAPQGLTEGSGEVDLYTRLKLNELYGKSGIIPDTVELVTDLRFGDHSDEVKLLQSWLAKDQEVYPKGLTTGWFGPLTHAAVIAFQEKYADEILSPQGLSSGTGIVDIYTRQKLYQLYGGE